MQALRDISPGHLISLHNEIGCPERSSHLAVCDYFLCGYLKAEACKNLPVAIEELKDTIHQNLAEVTAEKILRVMRIY